MTIPETMRAARMHAVGGDLILETIPTPTPGPLDVLVRVRACGIVPNLGNILRNWTTWFPELPLPPLPAVFGLDPSGEIAAVGSQTYGLRVGERVYVNPGRSCGTCRHCRGGDPISCRHYAFQGYFGFSPNALQTFADYPNGGMAQYMVAPASAIVCLPDTVTFDQGARFGYIGTAYAALRKAKAGPGDTILINGISGTLGLGCALLALALGVERILGTGRNRALLDRVKALAPDRIEVFALDDGSIADWAKARSDGGVDAFIDCLGPGARHETFLDAMRAMRRGATTVNIGAIAGPVGVDVHWLMDNNMRLCGSVWFTTEEGRQLASLARSGLLDLSVFETQSFPLSEVNRVLSGIANRDGGFSNFVIHPN